MILKDKELMDIPNGHSTIAVHGLERLECGGDFPHPVERLHGPLVDHGVASCGVFDAFGVACEQRTRCQP